jgi:hypothetical protein
MDLTWQLFWFCGTSSNLQCHVGGIYKHRVFELFKIKSRWAMERKVNRQSVMEMGLVALVTIG